MRRILFIYSLLEGLLGCFQFGEIMNKAAINRFSIVLSKYPQVGFLVEW